MVFRWLELYSIAAGLMFLGVVISYNNLLITALCSIYLLIFLGVS